MAGDNLKTVILALSASMTSCGVRNNSQWWAWGDLVQYPSQLTIEELYYIIVDAGGDDDLEVCH